MESPLCPGLVGVARKRNAAHFLRAPREVGLLRSSMLLRGIARSSAGPRRERQPLGYDSFQGVGSARRRSIVAFMVLLALSPKLRNAPLRGISRGILL